MQEVGHGSAGIGDHRVGVAAGRVGSAGVGIVATQVAGDSVDYGLRNLSSAGTIEKCGGVAINSLRQRRELRTDIAEVKRFGDSFCSRHRYSFLSRTWNRLRDHYVLQRTPTDGDETFTGVSMRILSTIRCCVLAVMSVSLGVAVVHADSNPAPPGKLVHLGGHKLHVNCVGKGNPVVVVENGLGDFSFDWLLVQSKVAAFSRICTYDRAGYAWSDPGPKPRT